MRTGSLILDACRTNRATNSAPGRRDSCAPQVFWTLVGCEGRFAAPRPHLQRTVEMLGSTSSIFGDFARRQQKQDSVHRLSACIRMSWHSGTQLDRMRVGQNPQLGRCSECAMMRRASALFEVSCKERPLSNSKKIAVRKKHRQKMRAAKAKLEAHLAGKMPAEQLPALARLCLIRRLRVSGKR